ncbi:DNA repair protein RecN [Ilyobacter polytropus]|uniref:DNA repair protein RecN n=1 Tax=Ilyobacter polytropus (strain ATCC 51220 / DSM 2926 / LMG 16218 / CuHBu1) TaxID=572544 RepID=E3H827_ILYPC|nr:DNA repair protein RecN [Ilyobacter polytropus]ADO83258.1 DNA replication and repair protein RecN [Ilyobacter polytropus DSM 2926]
MLRELRIENLAIIEELELEFGDGLITLTGETGAGKSIILSGINLLIGEKANVEMLRDGEEYLMAEGVFETSDYQTEELKELGIEVEEGELIVRRVLDKNGRGKAFVNGKRVPVSSLKQIMGTLVDLVGQHSHQMLLNKNNHIKLLDKFLGDKSQDIRSKIENTVERYGKISRKISEIEEIKKEIQEKKDFYEFQLNEINSLSLKSGEDEELEDEYKKLFNSGKIKENLINSYTLLKDGEHNAMSFIYNSKKFLESVSKYGKEFEEAQDKLEKIYYDLEDVVYIIENLEEDTDTDEFRLNELVDRLDKINSLKKKYGFTIEEILDYRDDLQKKLDTLHESNFEEKKLIKERDELTALYKKYAEKLSAARKESAALIESRMENELKYLNMKDSMFKISFGLIEGMGRNGSDQVEFLITTNKGQSPKPLSKIASGGEVSRIMLALKSIFSVVDNVPILVFDEIDTGVGGETVRKIASKLKDIGGNSQVVCITHSPAIASKATQQFYIEKKTHADKTVTTVRELNYKGRIEEIGRMLAGENITEAVLKHAKEILDEI